MLLSLRQLDTGPYEENEEDKMSYANIIVENI